MHIFIITLRSVHIHMRVSSIFGDWQVRHYDNCIVRASNVARKRGKQTCGTAFCVASSGSTNNSSIVCHSALPSQTALVLVNKCFPLFTLIVPPSRTNQGAGVSLDWGTLGQCRLHLSHIPTHHPSLHSLHFAILFTACVSLFAVATMGTITRDKLSHVILSGLLYGAQHGLGCKWLPLSPRPLQLLQVMLCGVEEQNECNRGEYATPVYSV